MRTQRLIFEELMRGKNHLCIFKVYSRKEILRIKIRSERYIAMANVIRP